MQGKLTTPAFLLISLSLVSCGSDDNKQLPCPASGLGMTASTGEKCSDVLSKVTDPSKPLPAAAQDCLAQFSDYKKYDCQDPQMGIDKTKRPLLIEVNPNSSFVDVYWTITNCAGSPKGRKLTIKALTIAGDDKCFFSRDPDIEKKDIEAGQQISMRVQFKPLAVGEHHADIYLISDAQNYPRMILPVCVRVTDKAPPSPDGGTKRDSGSTTSSFDCKDVSKNCNDTCHPGCSSTIKL